MSFLRIALLVVFAASSGEEPSQDKKKPTPQELQAARDAYENGKKAAQSGMAEEAVRFHVEAVRLDPDFAEAHEALAILYYEFEQSELKESSYRGKTFDHLFEVVRIGRGLSPKLVTILYKHMSAVLAGLLWLQQHQSPDGRWSADQFPQYCRKGGASCGGAATKSGSDLRASSFSLLAFLGAGYKPTDTSNFGQKQMGQTVHSGLKWILEQQKPDGYIGANGTRDLADHALAAIVLSEAYNLSGLALLRDSAQKAIDYLGSARTAGKEWSRDGGKGTPSIEATGWCLLAWWSGQIAGLKVPADAFEESLNELVALAASSDRTPMERVTALAVTCICKGSLVDPGPKELFGKVAEGGNKPDSRLDDALREYLSTANIMRGIGGKVWEELKKDFRGAYNKSQRHSPGGAECFNGSWDPKGRNEAIGRVTTTAVNLLILEAVYGYEPCLLGAREPAAQKK